MTKPSDGIFIAISVITLELLGGMQAYLSQLILPILAADLHAQNSYGVIMGVSAIASMVGLQIGAALMSKVPLPRLVLLATMLLVIGAFLSASAPHIVIYLLGAIIRGVSGSILAMTSIGAVALGLSGRARQLTLAFSSASWVVSSVIGPSYAAWVTHLLSWRWAMLLYLPLLLVARIIVAVSLKVETQPGTPPFSYKALILMIIGVSLTIVPATGATKVLLLVAGAVVLGRVAIVLMPLHTFLDKTPRRAALAGMFFLTGSYFSANELIGLTAHDVFQAGPDTLGVILMGGGLGWATMGLYCGLKPASTRNLFQFRSHLGLGLIFLAAVFMASWSVTQWHFPTSAVILVTVWSIAGIGMGLVYLDTLNIFFEDPAVSDGISMEEMASSSVIVESLASTMFVPLIASLVSLAFMSGDTFSSTPYVISWSLVAALAVISLRYMRHASPAENE